MKSLQKSWGKATSNEELGSQGVSWGKLKVAFLILLGASLPVSVAKGKTPVRSLKRRTPQLQISLSERPLLLDSLS